MLVGVKKRVLVVAGLLLLGTVAVYRWRREPAAIATRSASGPADPIVRPARAPRKPGVRKPRRKPRGPSRVPVVETFKRTFTGASGWVAAGRSRQGEDESMWAARKLEGRGIEATMLAGSVFTGLDPDAIYLVYGRYATREKAEARAAELKAKGVIARALETGPIRLAPGEEGAPPKRLTAIRGIVTDDGEPAAYHVERRLEGVDEKAGELDALMPDAAGYFFFWTNRRGQMTLAISLPLELDDVKDSGDEASVDLDDTGPAILDVVLEVESKTPGSDR